MAALAAAIGIAAIMWVATPGFRNAEGSAATTGAGLLPASLRICQNVDGATAMPVPAQPGVLVPEHQQFGRLPVTADHQAE
jgi:hypothetical protein